MKAIFHPGDLSIPGPLLRKDLCRSGLAASRGLFLLHLAVKDGGAGTNRPSARPWKCRSQGMTVVYPLG